MVFQGLIILDLRKTIDASPHQVCVNRISQIVNSKPLFLGRPTLPHERNQVFQCLFVRTIFFRGQLAGALVELRGHFGGFFRRTTERDENLGELGNVHGEKFNQENKNAGSGKYFPGFLRG
jgi:hypothetical protein